MSFRQVSVRYGMSVGDRSTPLTSVDCTHHVDGTDSQCGEHLVSAAHCSAAIIVSCSRVRAFAQSWPGQTRPSQGARATSPGAVHAVVELLRADQSLYLEASAQRWEQCRYLVGCRRV